MDTKVVCGVTLRKDPARESCFKVVDTDAQMVAWPDMSPQSRRERLHRHMNNEITSLDIAAQCLADFPDAPWDLRMQLARQAWDESRHVHSRFAGWPADASEPDLRSRRHGSHGEAPREVARGGRR